MAFLRLPRSVHTWRALLIVYFYCRCQPQVMVSLRTKHISNDTLGNPCFYSNIMTGVLPRCKSIHCRLVSPHTVTLRKIAVVLIAFLFAFMILCLLSVLFFALCRRAPGTTRPPQRVQHDAESSNAAMGERTAGRASMYTERNLGHELPGPRHHRLPPLFSKRESQDSIKGITPTASQPSIMRCCTSGGDATDTSEESV